MSNISDIELIKTDSSKEGKAEGRNSAETGERLSMAEDGRGLGGQVGGPKKKGSMFGLLLVGLPVC